MKKNLSHFFMVGCFASFCAFQPIQAQHKTSQKGHIKITVIDEDGKKHTINEQYNGEMPANLKKRIQKLKDKTGHKFTFDFKGGQDKNAQTFLFDDSEGKQTKLHLRKLEERLFKEMKEGEKHGSFGFIRIEKKKDGQSTIIEKNFSPNNNDQELHFELKDGGNTPTKSKVWITRRHFRKHSKDNKLQEITIDIKGDELVLDKHKWLHKEDGKLLEFHFGKDNEFTKEFTLEGGKKVKIKIHGVFNIVTLSSDKATNSKTKESASEMRKTENFKGLSGLNFYPNPNNGRFNLQFKLAETGDANVAIYDLQGNIIYNETIPNFKGAYNKAIDLSNQTKGVYIVRITQNGRSLTKKLKIE